MDCNSLSILAVLGTHVASLSLVGLAHFLIATAHSIPHTGIFRTRKDSSTVIVECVIIHVLKLIGLAKSIPGPKVLRVNLHCTPISFNSSGNILHFEVLMAHESPGCEAGPIEFESLAEVDNGFEMLPHEGVIVANNAASFWIVLVVIE